MDKSVDPERGPNPIDRHVGLRIRMRRKELGVSQEKLADSIGLTFQQVQKYERAANRVSASKLYEMARALNTPIGYFYEGLGEGPSLAGANNPRSDGVQDFLTTPEGVELAAAFPKIEAPRLRRKLLELIRTLSEDWAGRAGA